MDLRKFLLTDEMKEQFEEYSKLTTDAEIEEFHECWNEKYLQKTPEEQAYYDAKRFESLAAMSARVDELIQIVKFDEAAKKNDRRKIA